MKYRIVYHKTGPYDGGWVVEHQNGSLIDGPFSSEEEARHEVAMRQRLWGETMEEMRSSHEHNLTSSDAPDMRLQVRTYAKTGKTLPGVEFELVGDGEPVLIRDGHHLYSPQSICESFDVGGDACGVRILGVSQYRVPFGVVDREQIRALRDLLTDFLKESPADLDS